MQIFSLPSDGKSHLFLFAIYILARAIPLAAGKGFFIFSAKVTRIRSRPFSEKVAC
jgi:hypothetical protein